MRENVIIYEDEKGMSAFGSIKKLCFIKNLKYDTVMRNLSKNNKYIKKNFKIYRISFY